MVDVRCHAFHSRLCMREECVVRHTASTYSTYPTPLKKLVMIIEHYINSTFFNRMITKTSNICLLAILSSLAVVIKSFVPATSHT